jgi:hypothetical protein
VVGREPWTRSWHSDSRSWNLGRRPEIRVLYPWGRGILVSGSPIFGGLKSKKGVWKGVLRTGGTIPRPRSPVSPVLRTRSGIRVTDCSRAVELRVYGFTHGLKYGPWNRVVVARVRRVHPWWWLRVVKTRETKKKKKKKGEERGVVATQPRGLEAGVNEPLWKLGSRLFSRSGKWVLLFTHGLESGPRNRVVVAWGTGYQSTGVERVVRTR